MSVTSQPGQEPAGTQVGQEPAASAPERVATGQEPTVGERTQPTNAERVITSLPQWAQDEIHTARGQAAAQRVAADEAQRKQRQAEVDKAASEGRWGDVIKAKDTELVELRATNAELQADIRKRDRVELARQACRAASLDVVWADTLVGDTPDALAAHAKVIAERIPFNASSTESRAGLGRTPGQTREQLINQTEQELRAAGHGLRG